MWKLLAAFAVFAALAIYMLMQGGANVDMSGEKHDVTAPAHEPASAPATPTAAASEMVAAPASAASQ